MATNFEKHKNCHQLQSTKIQSGNFDILKASIFMIHLRVSKSWPPILISRILTGTDFTPTHKWFHVWNMSQEDLTIILKATGRFRDWISFMKSLTAFQLFRSQNGTTLEQLIVCAIQLKWKAFGPLDISFLKKSVSVSWASIKILGKLLQEASEVVCGQQTKKSTL